MIESGWVIASMKLSSGNTYYPEKRLTQSLKNILASAVNASSPAKATKIVISYSDGSIDTLCYREEESVTI
jgi:hypothetical protein